MSIFIGCIQHYTKTYCFNDWAVNLKLLFRQQPFDYLIVDNSPTKDFVEKHIEQGLTNTIWDQYGSKLMWARQRMVHSRNILREHFLEKTNHEWFLSLECDQFPTLQNINQLLEVVKKNKDIKILGALSMVSKYEPCCFKTLQFDPNNQANCFFQRWTPEECMGKGVEEVFNGGLGCVMIHRDVLRRVIFRMTNEPEKETASDDTYFNFDARRLGFKAYTDMSNECKHDCWAGKKLVYFKY